MRASARRSSLLLVIALLGYTAIQRAVGRAMPTAEAVGAAARERAPLTSLPLDFIENHEQWHPAVKFIARKGPLAARFEPTAIKLQLGQGQSTNLSLIFEGAAQDATLVGEGKRDGYYNFFIGNDPTKWRSKVATYSGVLYRGLYKGVDVRVREEGARLEYDLLLSAQADLEKVVIRADGAAGLEVANDGSLLVATATGALRQTPPITWEELPNGERRVLECRFRKIDEWRYGFEVSGRDRNLPLVIDPGLEWATYVGGGNWDEIHDLAAVQDGSGDVIAVGATLSTDFSNRPNPVAGFVTRFSATGALVYKTILVGSDREWIRGVAVSAAGEPVVVGESYSPDYPTTPGAYDTAHGFGADQRPGADAFVTRLSAAGDRIIFSTFLGTNEYDLAHAVAFAPSGALIVAGETASPTWPTTAGAYDRTYNCCTPYGEGNFSIKDAFIVRLSANGSQLEYSTYLGGNGDEITKGLVVDAQGFVTLTGLAYSPPNGADLPTTPGALAPAPLNRTTSSDGFLVRLKLDGNGTADLKYATFVGGDNTDFAYAVALDPFNPQDVLVGGVTYSTVGAVRFPTTVGTLRPSSTSVDGFVMRFRFPASGGNLIWSTLFGGFDYEEVADLAVSSDGSIALAGETRSFDFPTTQGAFDRSIGISTGVLFFDAYAARISADGSQLLYGTYLGGSYNDRHAKLTLVGANTAVVAGWTLSGDFPVTPGAHDLVLNNDGVGGVAPGVPFDGFLAKLTLLPDGDGDDFVAAPSLLAPANVTSLPTNDLINFDWTDVVDPAGLDGYHIQLNRRSDFVCCNDWQEVWTKTSDWVASVRFDGPYYWRVQTADRSGNLSSWSEVRTFNAGTSVSTLSANPPSVVGGNSSQGQVTLTSAAPQGGAVVALRSSNTAVATVPASVTIASGNHLATFTIATRGVSVTTSVTITASYGATTKDVTLTVTPTTAPPAAPVLSSPANNAQLPLNQSITFSWNAVAGAATYELQIDDASSFSAPLIVSAAGLAQTQSAHSFANPRSYWWRVRGRNTGGTNGAWSAARSFTITPSAPSPAALSALTLNPANVVGGNSAQGTVTLTSGAPSGGAVVNLSSSNTSAATTPASVTVAAGATTATFTVASRAVTASTPVTISAAYSGVARTATLTVTPQAPTASDTVAIGRAEYTASNRQLRVEATSSNSSAVLQCYVTSTNTLIGTLRNEGGGRYRADFSWSTNPQNITVRSSLGGVAARAVTLK